MFSQTIVRYGSSICLGLFSLSEALLIPPSLTGPLPVGVVNYELNNTSLKPTRDLMVSIYYPALALECKSYPRASDFYTEAFDTWADSWFTLPAGASATLTQHAYSAPPIAHSDFPLLFFSPGYGNSRLFYNGAAQDIASNGYIVVSMDHPNDTDFTVYPDGRIAAHTENDTQSLDVFGLIMQKDASDVLFIADHLEADAHRVIPGLKAPLATKRIGILGHSLGGATASQVMLQDPRFVAGINLDGSVPPPVETAGLSSPFLMMASMGHVLSKQPELDLSWYTFYENLRGWKRILRVNQTQHGHYSDNIFIKGALRPDRNPANDGLLNGTYMFQLESAYVLDFFDIWFKHGKGRLMNKMSPKWPEVFFDKVTYYNLSNSGQ